MPVESSEGGGAGHVCGGVGMERGCRAEEGSDAFRSGDGNGSFHSCWFFGSLFWFGGLGIGFEAVGI